MSDKPAAAVEQAGAAQRRNRVEHARAAYAHRLLVADHSDLDPVRRDRDALDRALGGAHPAGDVAALQCRPRRARGGDDLAAMDEGHFGVGADIHHERRRGARPQRLGGEQRGDMVAPDEAADIRREMKIRAGGDRDAEIARLDVDRLAQGGDEGGAAELTHRQAEQQMVHGRVAAHGHIEDIGRPRSHRATEVVRERVDGGDRGGAQLLGRAAVADGVIDAADHVGAPGDLRVLDAEARDAGAGRQIDEEAGDIGGAEIDGQTERRRTGGRREGDRLALAQMHARRPVGCAQQAGQLAGGGKVDRGNRHGRGADHAVGVALRIAQRRRRNRDVEADHHRVERQGLAAFAGVDLRPYDRRE